MTEKAVHIEIGPNQPVTIDKLFGPMIFADLRITADTSRGCWVIEREWVATGEFVEWCTIPAQIDAEFQDGELDEAGGE